MIKATSHKQQVARHMRVGGKQQATSLKLQAIKIRATSFKRQATSVI